MLRLITLGVLAAFLVSSTQATGRMICYYDSQSYWREGAGKMDIHDLESALPLCNHLVYGFAKIDPDNFHLIPFDESKELDSGRGHYKAITNLKNQFPGLRVLLSVGGQRDTDDSIKYLTLVETQENRHAFIESAKTILKQYKFDGLDLAWQFPEVKVQKERSKLSQIWHSIKKVFTGSRYKDENEELHREGFNALLREAKQVFHREGLLLTAAVLPNINSAIYFETRPTMESLEYLTIWAFDFKTPLRNSKEADFPSALHKAGQRKENETIDGVIRSWLERPGVDARKIFLGLQTFGRTWKLTEESQISGVPPITADGPGQEGPLTAQPGYFSYSEVCTKTQNPNNQKTSQNLLRLVLDPSHRTGSYSWRLPQGDDEGLWVGFQDIPALIDKTAYVQTKGLGGVAMVDVSSDDYKGVCTGTKYPLLRAAKQGL